MPLIARNLLGGSALTYGALVGAFGVGWSARGGDRLRKAGRPVSDVEPYERSHRHDGGPHGEQLLREKAQAASSAPTVLSLGPAPLQQADSISGHLANTFLRGFS